MKLIYFKLIILFLIAILPVVFFNYLIDPYGIITDVKPDLWYGPGYEPNQHYAKMRHLINNRHSWDSYLFGSSRAGKINPALIPGGNYYNMNYSEGLPGEHLSDIEILLKNGIPVKNVIVGLDNFSYTMSPEDHVDQIMRHAYDATLVNRAVFLIKYLCSTPQLNMINNIKHVPDNLSINFNIYGNGMQKLELIDRQIEKNIDHHVKSDRFMKANNIPFDASSEDKYMILMDDTIKDIIEIIRLSHKYHFNVRFFINPTHNKFYIQGNPYHFLLFKAKLAQVTDYWDFSGFNSITTSNYYWYETSHYRTIVGDLIICRMFNCYDVPVPEDFGVFVTKKSSEAHIKKQRDELNAVSNL